MFGKKIIDDSKAVISHYRNSLSKNDNDLLDQIIISMNAWSNLVKTKKLNEEDKNIFIGALQHKNEFLWYETGTRLSKLLPDNTEIKDIFISLFNSTKIQSRFNIVALSKDFPKEFAERILSKAITDKSNKIRMKVADIILTRQEKDLLPLLQNHLKQEENKKVMECIQFTLDNFDKMKRNPDGSLSLSIG